MKQSKLIHGKCFSHIKTLEKYQFDLVVCDPPYGTTAIHWDEALDFKKLWRFYDRVVKPGGVIVLFGSMPFTALTVLSNLKWFKYCLVWDKNKCGSPGLAKYRPMKTHEDIMIFVKPGGKPTYRPQMEEGEPYFRKATGKTRCNTHKYGFKHYEGEGRTTDNKGTRYPKSIVLCKREFSAQQQVHPTQKPVGLLMWLVRTYSKSGDWVLDNTCGSGSTGVACLETKRKFVLVEMEKDYVNVARRRLIDTQKRLATGVKLFKKLPVATQISSRRKL